MTGNFFASAPDELDRIRSALSEVGDLYPGFERWFEKTVVPQIGRTRFVLASGPRDAPDAVVVAKRTVGERKLCTVWVRPSARGRSAGPLLMEEAMELLGTRRPLITVPDIRLAEFLPSFARWGFVETQRLPGRYRPDVVEHVFNGVLAPDPDVDVALTLRLHAGGYERIPSDRRKTP